MSFLPSQTKFYIFHRRDKCFSLDFVKRLNPKENKTEKRRTNSSHIFSYLQSFLVPSSITIDVFICTLIWPISLSTIFHYWGKTSTKASPSKCPTTSIFNHYMYAQSYVGEAQADFYYLKPVVFFKQHLFFRCDIFDLVMFLTGFLKKKLIRLWKWRASSCQMGILLLYG